MDVFVVERFLVGWSTDEVEGLVRRIDDIGPELAAHGVRHVESIVIPADETCLSVFEGPDALSVRTANERWELPADRVLAGISLRSGS